MTKLKNILKIIVKGLYFTQLLIFMIAVCLGIYLFVDTDRVVQGFARYLVIEKNVQPPNLSIIFSNTRSESRQSMGARI